MRILIIRPVLSSFICLVVLCATSNGAAVNHREDTLVTERTSTVPTGMSCNGVHVEVIISAHIHFRRKHDFLVLYWEVVTILPGDRVELFDHDPSVNLSKPLYSVAVDKNDGWVITNVTETHNSILPLQFEKYCLGFWAAYIRNDSGSIAAYSCLTTEPRWMEESWHAISRLSLASMFIPGSHNSAAYKEGWEVKFNNIGYKFTINQDISVLNQLLWGIRALDLRIAYLSNDKIKWWCNHNLMKILPLEQMFTQVKTFLENTEEIIILDVHHFPVGFVDRSEKRHSELIAMFVKELRGFLIPSSYGWAATLDELKKSGGKAILAYNSDKGSSIYKWNPVQQKWGNVQTLENLVSYIDGLFKTQINAPWAVMAELTPGAVDIFFKYVSGLRDMAAEVNPTITRKFNGEWGRRCNIVHCDFVRGTGIVKAAIKWNLQRAGSRTCKSMNSNSTEVRN